MRLSATAWISHGRVQRRFGLGPRSRLDLLRNLVTALVRHERIEAPRARADEMRFYAEHVSATWRAGGWGWGTQTRPTEPPTNALCLSQLIDYAKRGESDAPAMRMADFWLTVSGGRGSRVGRGSRPLPPASQE